MDKCYDGDAVMILSGSHDLKDVEVKKKVITSNFHFLFLTIKFSLIECI